MYDLLKTFSKPKFKNETKFKYFDNFLGWIIFGSTIKDLALTEIFPRTPARLCQVCGQPIHKVVL